MCGLENGYLIYDTGSEFKLHFETLCNSYGIKHKPTTIKNPQANAICERVHQVLGTMMRTAEIDMADSIHPADIDSFIDNAVWAIRSTFHTVFKASPGAAIFGRDMLFDIPFIADWNKIGDYRQRQTDRSNTRINSKHVDYDKWGHLAPLSWVKMLWRSLHHFNIHLHLEYPTIPNPRERDQVVMELIFGKVTDKKTIRSLSRCRGSLEIIFLSDMATADGRYLEQLCSIQAAK